ncbi:MAG: tetraacyldisaccharide 4'-kinase [Alphaproteobacteria bacterium]|nr:tetraacyldisaccharide 4'-kinase [Candidatus Jidaibacter sp.]
MLNYALLPFSLLYWIGHLVTFYIINRPKKVGAYVICVGNAIVGGSGKTPICAVLAKSLNAGGHNVAIITRGYARKSISLDVIKVRKDSDYRDVGDEALILSQYAPTYVSCSKVKAAERAILDGADVVIMDDGYQNNSIHKDFNVLLISAEYGIGNGFILPAGPLREPFSAAAGKADLKILVGYNKLDSDIKCDFEAKAQFVCDADVSGKKVVTLSSISNPDIFIETVQSLGADIVKSIVYDDHYGYSDSDIEEIIRDSDGLAIVTTEKDLVKIASKYRSKFMCVKVEMSCDFSNILSSI